MENSKIEWTNHTFSPWIGCQKVSPGCDNCYAENQMDKRWGKVEWGPHGERKRTTEAYWRQPLKWNAKAKAAQEAWERAPIVGRSRERPERPRVFCASLSDVFDNQVPPEWRGDLFALIEETPELDWLLLTKRPENVAKMMAQSWVEEPLPNVWLGFTAEDQENFDRRWPLIARVPAVVRFCSYEPAIGPLRIWRTDGPPRGLGWLICGGESGQGHRWMDPAWERDVRLDCGRAGIAYFFKQLAGKKPIPADFPLVRQFPEVAR